MSLKLSTKEKTIVSKTKVPTITVKGESAGAFYAVVDLANGALAAAPEVPAPAEVVSFLQKVDAGRDLTAFPKATASSSTSS